MILFHIQRISLDRFAVADDGSCALLGQAN